MKNITFKKNYSEHHISQTNINRKISYIKSPNDALNMGKNIINSKESHYNNNKNNNQFIYNTNGLLETYNKDKTQEFENVDLDKLVYECEKYMKELHKLREVRDEAKTDMTLSQLRSKQRETELRRKIFMLNQKLKTQNVENVKTKITDMGSTIARNIEDMNLDALNDMQKHKFEINTGLNLKMFEFEYKNNYINKTKNLERQQKINNMVAQTQEMEKTKLVFEDLKLKKAEMHNLNSILKVKIDEVYTENKTLKHTIASVMQAINFLKQIPPESCLGMNKKQKNSNLNKLKKIINDNIRHEAELKLKIKAENKHKLHSKIFSKTFNINLDEAHLSCWNKCNISVLNCNETCDKTKYSQKIMVFNKADKIEGNIINNDNNNNNNTIKEKNNSYKNNYSASSNRNDRTVSTQNRLLQMNQEYKPICNIPNIVNIKNEKEYQKSKYNNSVIENCSNTNININTTRRDSKTTQNTHLNQERKHHHSNSDAFILKVLNHKHEQKGLENSLYSTKFNNNNINLNPNKADLTYSKDCHSINNRQSVFSNKKNNSLLISHGYYLDNKSDISFMKNQNQNFSIQDENKNAIKYSIDTKVNNQNNSFKASINPEKNSSAIITANDPMRIANQPQKQARNINILINRVTSFLANENLTGKNNRFTRTICSYANILNNLWIKLKKINKESTATSTGGLFKELNSEVYNLIKDLKKNKLKSMIALEQSEDSGGKANSRLTKIKDELRFNSEDSKALIDLLMSNHKIIQVYQLFDFDDACKKISQKI